jgi:hypothetical protein
MGWSDDARVMGRPFSSYASIASHPSDDGFWWAGAARWLLLVAGFVSLTSAGRLLLGHLLFAPISWLFAPLLQIFWLLIVARILFPRRVAPRRLIELYFFGHGPWLLLLLVLAGVCLLAGDAWAAFDWMLSSGVLPALVVGATLWCCFLSYAMFRAALKLGRIRSLLSALLFYAGYALSLTAWFALTGQLLPLLGVMA